MGGHQQLLHSREVAVGYLGCIVMMYNRRSAQRRQARMSAQNVAAVVSVFAQKSAVEPNRKINVDQLMRPWSTTVSHHVICREDDG